MKSKLYWIWPILAILMIAVMVGGWFLHSWWHSPGVHVLGNKANIDLQQDCYIINDATGKVEGYTTVMITGLVTNGDEGEYGGKFEGYITVDGYVIPLSETDSEKAYGKIEKPYLDISYSAKGGYRVVDGKPISMDDSYAYDVEIDTRRPEDVIVRVANVADSYCYYVVHADSEEAAIQWFNEFKQERYGDDYPTVG